MSQDRAEPGRHASELEPGRVQGAHEPRRNEQHGQGALERVEQECGDSEAGTERAVDVGGAQVPRAERAHVDALEPAPEPQAPRQGAAQVADQGLDEQQVEAGDHAAGGHAGLLIRSA